MSVNRVIPILVVLAIAVLAIGPIVAALNGQHPSEVELARPADAAVVIALPDRLDVKWADRTSDESAYQVERSTDGANWTAAASLPADSTLFSDTGLTCETTYYYRVRSTRAVDNRQSEFTAVVSATTGVCPPAAPVSLMVIQ